MKKIVAVIFGGRSAEHDVSIITAHIPIIQSLLAMGDHEVMPIYIAKDGSWYSDPAMNDLKYFKAFDFDARLAKLKKLQLLFDGGLHIVWPGLVPKTVKIDIVFPAMHGTYGEDGSPMGLLRMANVPFVGCDIFASAVAMDKVLTKQLLVAEGIPTPLYVWFLKHAWETKKGECLKDVAKVGLRYPLFVKPVHLGSSIGISKVKQVSELEHALEVVFHYDDKVLIEEGVPDLIEVTLPIMGNHDLQLGAIERPLNESEFFDFGDKYKAGGKKGGGVNNQYSELPAKIDEKLAERVRKLGEKTYRALGCAGIARIDFLIDGANGEVFVNEVNTLPGSLYHHNWKQAGVSAIELIKNLLRLAEERFVERREITYAFSSEILSNL